jgi:hypothetical protein
MGVFAVSLALAALGLGMPAKRELVAASAAASVAGFVLLWLSRRREPRPWRADDVMHYERRAAPRPKP